MVIAELSTIFGESPMSESVPGELVVDRLGEVWVLRLRGEHDLATAPTLEAELSAVFGHGSKVAVDLTEASFIDSSIVARLASAAQQAERDGHGFVVCAPVGSMARRLFELVGVERALHVVDSRQDGLAVLGGGSG